MRIARWWSALTVAALLLAGGSALAAPTRLTLLHVNDSHSRLDAWGPKDLNLDGVEGGLTKAATVIGLLEQLEPNAFLVHAGDAFHGDLYFPYYLAVPEWVILKDLGLVAFGVGNHEFEYENPAIGLANGALKLALDQTAANGFVLPAVSANLKPTTQAVLGDYIKPHLIVTKGGVRIGIFGFTVPEFMSADYVLDPGSDWVGHYVGLAASEVQALRSQQPNGDPPADVVICLSHLGMTLSRALAQAGPSIGLDVVVQGHDHQYALQQPESYGNPGQAKTFLVSAGSFYRYVGDLRLVYDPAATPKLALAGYHLFSIDALIPRQPDVRDVVNGLKAEIRVATSGFEPPDGEDFWHKRLAYALGTFEGEAQPGIRNRSTAVGNLVTDIYRTAAGSTTDIGFEASGFAEVSLPWGPIVGADVFRMMSYGYNLFGWVDPLTGFGAQLVRFELTGPELVGGLTAALSQDTIQVSGMRYAIKGGQVVPGSVVIGGRPVVLDGRKKYSITTTDTLLYLLDSMTGQQLPYTPLGISAYEALRDGVVRMGYLVPNAEARVRNLDLP